MRSKSKTNNIAQSTEDQKLINDSSELKTEDSEVKVEISTKLIDKICLHFNMIISKK